MPFATFSAPYNTTMARRQRGAGRLGDFWRQKIKPWLRSSGKRALKHGLRMGARTAGDIILNNRSPLKALRSAGAQTLRDIQAGRGGRRRRSGRVIKKRQKMTRKKTVNPITLWGGLNQPPPMVF